jgi:ElaB/YqjD/DUF883 family membrane-anchored ribosome-binding protein
MKEANEHSLIVELIHSKFNELSTTQAIQNESLKELMKSEFKEINNRIDLVVEQKKIQNGRVLKSEIEIKALKDSTKVWRFIEKKPYISIAVSIVFVIGILYLSKHFTFVEFMKLIF